MVCTNTDVNENSLLKKSNPYLTLVFNLNKTILEIGSLQFKIDRMESENNAMIDQLQSTETEKNTAEEKLQKAEEEIKDYKIKKIIAQPDPTQELKYEKLKVNTINIYFSPTNNSYF